MDDQAEVSLFYEKNEPGHRKMAWRSCFGEFSGITSELLFYNIALNEILPVINMIKIYFMLTIRLPNDSLFIIILNICEHFSNRFIFLS